MVKIYVAAVLALSPASGVVAFSPLATNRFVPKSRGVAMRQSSNAATETNLNSPAAAAPSSKREKILKEPALWEYNFGLQDPGLTMPHGIVSEVTPPEKFEITEEQIRTLEEDGVVHIKGVFDSEWVDYLRKATAHQVDEPHFWAFAGTASKLYDYIQRNVWQTNKAFADFYYHSAMGHVLAQCGRTDEIRISTDLLMVNPNKGFKWHQDNQNGPITWEEGIRFWITMDETPKDYGAPVYLKGSHKNDVVDEQAVFVDIESKGLEDYKNKRLEFRTMPGDMLIWHPKTIHKVDGPSDGIWTSYRRVLGGTVAKAGSIYHDKRGSGGVLSDLGRHELKDGDKLQSSFFPIVYPRFDDKEASDRDSGHVGRSPRDIVLKLGGLAGKASVSLGRWLAYVILLCKLLQYDHIWGQEHEENDGRQLSIGCVVNGQKIWCMAESKKGMSGAIGDYVVFQLGRHTLKIGDDLQASCYPIVYPRIDAKEANDKDSGHVGKLHREFV